MATPLQHREYVIDANVPFSFLISGRESYLVFLADNQVFTTDFVFEEIQIHQEVIVQRTKLLLEKFQKFALGLFERITVVPNLLISTQNYYRAFILCRDIDPKGTDCAAFSLALDHSLLTRDEPLAVGLRAKGFTNIVLRDELFAQTDDSDSTN